MYRPPVGQATGISDNSVMPQSAVSQPIVYTAAPLATVDVDLVIVPWFEDDSPSAIAGLDRAIGGDLARALTTKEFAARLYDQFAATVIDGTWKPRRVLFVGSGRLAVFNTATARRIATVGALAARQRRVGRVGFLLRPGLPDPAGDFDLAGFMQATVEGLTLAEFSAGVYKTSDQPPAGAGIDDCAAAAQRHVARKRAAHRGGASSAAGCSASAATSRASSPTSRATR